MSKYRYISAVGQLNDAACWAACLKWWYKTVLSINPSQQKLIDHYSSIANSDGRMSDTAMQQIIRDNAMVSIPFTAATEFNPPELEFLLTFGPVYTAYTESGTHKRHVNVIYELIGTEAWAEVRVMEPQARKKATGSEYIGKHLKKPISDFNMLGAVYAGISRAAFTGVP